jgi:hypothetical protein
MRNRDEKGDSDVTLFLTYSETQIILLVIDHFSFLILCLLNCSKVTGQVMGNEP